MLAEVISLTSSQESVVETALTRCNFVAGHSSQYLTVLKCLEIRALTAGQFISLTPLTVN